MRQIIVIAAATFALGGCASFSSISMDTFRPAPPVVKLQLESVPPGADAVTSAGPGCRTPCAVDVPASGNLTVSYSLARYQPATVPVTVTVIPGDFTSAARTVIDPDPVVVELQPAAPPRRAARRAVKKRLRAAPAAAAPAAASPFPAPR